MCGVAGYVGEWSGGFGAVVDALAHRGPDAHGVYEENGWCLVHTRLSIIDLDSRSNQPFVYGSIVLSYNGELWNFGELRQELRGSGYMFRTESDTEVVAAMLDYWGADAALRRLEGMFAMAWYDERDGKIRLARDRFGETPLHLARFVGGWAFASELKVLRAMGAARGEHWVEPGTYVELEDLGEPRHVKWYEPRIDRGFSTTFESASNGVRAWIQQGTIERTIADVPVCTLLSGGIDSAAVAFHLAGRVPSLVAYCATLEGQRGRDVACAEEVACALGIELRIVEVPEPTGRDLAEVVRHIEQPHKAQVEIGWACLHLARRMREDGFKVTFSGEGSDELWASYGFAYHALVTQGQDWYDYRRELFRTQHRKNFARCNKIFMAHGVECRLPFLNTGLVEYALSLPQDCVQQGKTRPKAVIQEAYRGVLPDSVVNRPKLAFQDGARLKEAAAAAVHDPKALYSAEFRRMYA